MKFALIAALCSKNRVIGKDNDLPWHLPNDLKHFKKTTLGHCILMGRKTFESIGRPLPKRRNIVISRNKSWSAPGVEVFSSIDAAIEALKKDAVEKVFIIGGASIYASSINKVDELYLTWIDQEYSGDTFFPEIDMSHYSLQKEEKFQEPIPHRFSYYQKIVS